MVTSEVANGAKGFWLEPGVSQERWEVTTGDGDFGSNVVCLTNDGR